jgi:hypothetical protein
LIWFWLPLIGKLGGHLGGHPFYFIYNFHKSIISRIFAKSLDGLVATSYLESRLHPTRIFFMGHIIKNYIYDQPLLIPFLFVYYTREQYCSTHKTLIYEPQAKHTLDC